MNAFDAMLLDALPRELRIKMLREAEDRIRRRIENDKDVAWVYGLAAPFGPANSYGEVLEPGTLKLLPENATMLPLLAEHSTPIGVWTRVWETPEGVMAEGVLSPEGANAARELIDDGDMKLSITFGTPRKGDVEWKERSARLPGDVVKVPKGAPLREISLVTSPAWRETWVKWGKAPLELVEAPSIVPGAGLGPILAV